MKNIFTILLLFLVSFSTINAQSTFWSRNAYNMTPEKMVKRLDKEVQLNERQEKRLYPVFADYLALLKSGKYVMTQEMLNVKKKEYYLKVCSILTFEQRTKWKDSRRHDRIFKKQRYPQRLQK